MNIYSKTGSPCHVTLERTFVRMIWPRVTFGSCVRNTNSAVITTMTNAQRRTFWTETVPNQQTGPGGFLKLNWDNRAITKEKFEICVFFGLCFFQFVSEDIFFSLNGYS